MWRYIDHQGTFWPLSELRDRYRLTQFPDNHAAHDWAVKNIGLILIGASKRSIRIRLRPASAPGIAIAAVLRHLTDTEDTRASISSFDGEWRDFVCPTALSAAEKLASLSLANHSVKSSDFRRRRLSVHELAENETLYRVLEQSKTLGDTIDVQELGQQLSGLVANRVIILEAAPASSKLVIRYLGQGFSVFSPRWVANAIGREMEEQPDVRYGQWSAEPYRAARASTVPVIDDIDAVVVDPYTGASRRSRYRRLIVPIARRHGRSLLLGCSTIDSGINLRKSAV
jgi:hypothetical protein